MSPRHLRLVAMLRHRDAANVDEVFPTARRAAIRAAIVAGDGSTPSAASQFRRLRVRRRLVPARIVVPAFAALVASVIAAITLAVVISSPTPHGASTSRPAIHASPVSFRYPTRGPDSGDIIATVTDPLAAQSSLDAAFRAAGLDITVALVAASPSAVGTVVEISEPSSGPQIETLVGGSCVTGGRRPGNCPVGVKIPRHFTGSGSIVLGRPAKPGEAYETTNSAFAPGEALHCSGLIGKTVAAAMPELAARGITVQWQQQASTSAPAPVTTATATTSQTTTTDTTADTTTTGTSTSSTATATATATTKTAAGAAQGDAGAPKGSDHVLDGIPIKAGVVMLETQADPLTPAQLAQETLMYGAGC